MQEYTRTTTVEAYQWKGKVSVNNDMATLEQWGVKIRPAESYFDDEAALIIDHGDIGGDEARKAERRVEKNAWIVKLLAGPRKGRFDVVRNTKFQNQFTIVV